MDLLTIIGLTIGIGAVYWVLYQGEITSLLYNPLAAMLVIGGTLGATLMTYNWKLIKRAIPALLYVVFPPKHYAPEQVIEKLVNMSEQAKRSGVDSLRGVEVDDRFLEDGLEMVIENLDDDVIRSNLEKEIFFTRRRHQMVSDVFRQMGTYAPIFGLLGTLIGIVQVLRDIGNPEEMGAAMAIAITTTFYGIFLTNFLFLPIAGKLSTLSEDEILVKEVIIEGVLSIKQGDVPYIVSRKLQAYLAFKLREKEGK